MYVCMYLAETIAFKVVILLVLDVFTPSMFLAYQVIIVPPYVKDL